MYYASKITYESKENLDDLRECSPGTLPWLGSVEAAKMSGEHDSHNGHMTLAVLVLLSVPEALVVLDFQHLLLFPLVHEFLGYPVDPACHHGLCFQGDHEDRPKQGTEVFFRPYSPPA